MTGEAVGNTKGGVVLRQVASEVGQINEVADIDTVTLVFVHDWLWGSTSKKGWRPAVGVEASPEPPVAHTPAGPGVSQT